EFLTVVVATRYKRRCDLLYNYKRRCDWLQSRFSLKSTVIGDGFVQTRISIPTRIRPWSSHIAIAEQTTHERARGLQAWGHRGGRRTSIPDSPHTGPGNGSCSGPPVWRNGPVEGR